MTSAGRTRSPGAKKPSETASALTPDSKASAAPIAAAASKSVELISTSAVRLAASLAVSATAMYLLDRSQFRQVLSSNLQTSMSAAPHYATAILPVVTYVLCVLWHLYFRTEASKLAAQKATESKQGLINRSLVAWNFFLMCVSMALFTGLVAKCVDILRVHGAKRYLCDGNLQWDATEDFDVGYLARIVMLTKFIELFDTFFLITRGRDIPFLHWYHHATVLLYCWLTTLTLYPSNAFGLVNTGVHSIMYYYYARAAQGVRLGFAKFVTQIQISQMLLGMLLSGVLMALHFALPEGECTGGNTINESGMLITVFLATIGMYCSYLVLFALFYLRRYQKNK